MTDREVEEIIRSNINLQMNLAGIRGDFEAKLQRTWVGLTKKEFQEAVEQSNGERNQVPALRKKFVSAIPAVKMDTA